MGGWVGVNLNIVIALASLEPINKNQQKTKQMKNERKTKQTETNEKTNEKTKQIITNASTPVKTKISRIEKSQKLKQTPTKTKQNEINKTKIRKKQEFDRKQTRITAFFKNRGVDSLGVQEGNPGAG